MVDICRERVDDNNDMDEDYDIDYNKAETEVDDKYNSEINNPYYNNEDLNNESSHNYTASQCLIQICLPSFYILTLTLSFYLR